MKNKPISELTSEEKEWLDTVVINYIIAQSDGFQLGYAQAINDFTENIIDYWEGSDDKPQQSVLDALVDLGVELGKRKQNAVKNTDIAKDRGYEQYYKWSYENGRIVDLYTKGEGGDHDDA